MESALHAAGTQQAPVMSSGAQSRQLLAAEISAAGSIRLGRLLLAAVGPTLTSQLPLHTFTSTLPAAPYPGNQLLTAEVSRLANVYSGCILPHPPKFSWQALERSRLWL